MSGEDLVFAYDHSGQYFSLRSNLLKCFSFPFRSWSRSFSLTFTFISLLTFVFASASSVQAYTYHVNKHATGKSDNYTCVENRTDSAKPFETIYKAASCATTAGDVVKVKPGIYRETVTPQANGVTFEADGNGVTVSGADELDTTKWSWYTGSYDYVAYPQNMSIEDPIVVNGVPQPAYDSGYLPANDKLFAPQLFVDGVMKPESRWPNLTSGNPLRPNPGDWARPDSLSSASGNGVYTYTLTDSDMGATGKHWYGATIHIWMGNQWGSATAVVRHNSTNILEFDLPASFGNLLAGQSWDVSRFKYYLTKNGLARDQDWEWDYTYNDPTKVIFLRFPASTQRDTLSRPIFSNRIEYKARNYAFDLRGRQSITVRGFNIFAATVLTDSGSHYTTIDRINAKYISHYNTITDTRSGWASFHSRSMDTGIILKGRNSKLTKSIIAHSAGNGVSVIANNWWQSSGNFQEVSDNVIHDVGYMGTYNPGIFVSGYGQKLLRNTIYNTGREGIDVSGQANFERFVAGEIKNNNIFNTLLLNHDGGGILAFGIDGKNLQNINATCAEAPLKCNSVAYPEISTVISNNSIHDLVASHLSGEHWWGAGIYMDVSSKYFTLRHNVLWNNRGDAIRLNVDSSNISVGNDVQNNTVGLGHTGSIASTAVTWTTPLYLNNTIQYNLFSQDAWIQNSPTWGQIYTGQDTFLKSYSQTPSLIGNNNYSPSIYFWDASWHNYRIKGNTVPYGSGAYPYTTSYGYFRTGPLRPSYLNSAYHKIEAETYDGSLKYTATAAPATTDPQSLVDRLPLVEVADLGGHNTPNGYNVLQGTRVEGLKNLTPGDWIRFNNIQLSGTITQVDLRMLITPSQKYGIIDVYADMANGSFALVGSSSLLQQTVSSESSFAIGSRVITLTQSLTGTHDFILRFRRNDSLTTSVGSLDGLYFK